jgi:hypothetical protein
MESFTAPAVYVCKQGGTALNDVSYRMSAALPAVLDSFSSCFKNVALAAAAAAAVPARCTHQLHAGA